MTLTDFPLHYIQCLKNLDKISFNFGAQTLCSPLVVRIYCIMEYLAKYKSKLNQTDVQPHIFINEDIVSAIAFQ